MTPLIPQTNRKGFKEAHWLTLLFLGVFSCALVTPELKAAPSWKANPETLRTEAAKGDPYYQGLLGIQLRYGVSGLKVNLAESEEWSKKAATAKGAFGLCNLASIEMQRRNYEKGRFLFDEAHLHSNLLRLSRADDAVAIFCLGLVELESPPQNIPKAVRHLEKAARMGFAPAQARLGMIKFNGIGITRDPKGGLRWLELAARNGSPHGKFHLGMAYSIGEGVSFDQRKSMQLIRESANQGFGTAQLTLGVKYANGEGVEQDYAQAKNWLTQASSQGIGEATMHLRRCETMLRHQPSVVIKPTPPAEPKKPMVVEPKPEPETKPPVPTSPDPVVSEDNSLRLQKARHLLLVERKIDEAKVALTELASHGIAEAQRLLGIANYRSKEFKTAQVWFMKAAQQKDPQAQRYLGMIYFLGQGVERNYSEANAWLGKAAAQGDQEAIRYQEILQKFYKE